jgi:hypothetical protein
MTRAGFLSLGYISLHGLHNPKSQDYIISLIGFLTLLLGLPESHDLLNLWRSECKSEFGWTHQVPFRFGVLLWISLPCAKSSRELPCKTVFVAACHVCVGTWFDVFHYPAVVE